MICAFVSTYAQQLTVKTVNLRPQDARARTNPRNDAKGQKCAIIRVGVVGVENLVFPDAVGNVERSLSEYVVYVPDGLKSLKYNNKSGENLGSINFEDYDLEINSLASYDVVLESANHLRSAIFSIQPANATLTFDGKKVDVNSDGIAMINKPVGEYSYTVKANGYLEQSGLMILTEDDISTVTDIFLEQQLYPVNIYYFPENATFFIDNIPYSKESITSLKLSKGKHTIRTTATNYRDDERTIYVGTSSKPIYITLKEAKHKVVKYEEERTRTSVNVRKHWDLLLGVESYGKHNDNDENGLDFTLQIYHAIPFGAMFERRYGLSIGIPKNGAGTGDSDRFYFAELSLGAGVSVPFGNYNQCQFSSFLSVFGRYKFTDDAMFAFGTRLTAKLDISHFIIEIDGSYSPNYGRVFPAFCIGYKFYR